MSEGGRHGYLSGMKFAIHRRAALVAAVFFPCLVPLGAEARFWVGVGSLSIMEKVEHTGPHRYQGFLFSSELGAEGRGGKTEWGTCLSFDIGELSRATEDNKLYTEWLDQETGSVEGSFSSTNHPLRIKGRWDGTLSYPLPLSGGLNVALGGNLAYRFDIGIFRDYPVFATALDFGPAIQAGIGLPGESTLGLSLSAPLVSLLNEPPYTGTSGWIIEHITSDPSAIILTGKPASCANRPLVAFTTALFVPLGAGFYARPSIDVECFALGKQKTWSSLSARALVAIAYSTGEVSR